MTALASPPSASSQKKIAAAPLFYAAIVLLSFAVPLIFRQGGLGAIQLLQSWPLLVHALLPVLLFRGWGGRIAYGLAAVSVFGLVWVLNDVKVDLTQMPLTWADLKVFGLNPAASLREVKLPMVLHYVVLISVCAVVAGLVSYIAYAFCRGPHLLIRSLGAVVLLVSGVSSYQSFVTAADTARRNGLVETWSPMALKVLSERFGTMGFVAYSRLLDETATGPYFSATKATALAAEDVQNTLNTMLAPVPAKNMLPNIAIVMAESTFDPNLVFHLSKPVKSPLFDKTSLTHARGPLFVTPIGGGTWISEFEVLTGLDARLFGFHGRYTHSMLAPLVKRTLVHAMRENGYVTTAYYASQANFFNIGKAMKYYGFERAYSGTDLGLNTKDWNITDPALVDSALRLARADKREGPVFNYVQLVENHSPHPCTEYKIGDRFPVTFAAGASFAHNCQLNVYLKRMKSTVRAIEKLKAHFSAIERKTGRPYLLVIFGDHQPHSFTGTRTAYNGAADFRAFRKKVDPRVTFFHMLGTAPKRIRWRDGQMAPLYLLATMTGAYAARSREEQFLPINAKAFSKCGHNLLGTRADLGVDTTYTKSVLGSTSGGKACAFIEKLVATHKRDQVMRLR